MIDTCMVLWNQGSRHKGVKVLFTFALICISLSLLLVTSIIPGWILLTRNTDRTTITYTDSTQLSSVQGGNLATVVAATQIPVVSATASTICATSTPFGGAVQIGHRRQQVSSITGQSTLLPSPTVVRASGPHANPRTFIEAHAIYSGRSSGALSHLHSSAPEELLPTPTITLASGTTATSSSITITPHAMRPHIAIMGMTPPRLNRSEEIMKANPTVLADHLLVAGQIPQECTPAH